MRSDFIEQAKRIIVGEDVLAVARSLRAEPEAWSDDRELMLRPYRLIHPSGLEVWVANSVYGMSISAWRGEGRGRSQTTIFGDVGMLSTFGLSIRHWVLWAAARSALQGRPPIKPKAIDLLKADS